MGDKVGENPAALRAAVFLLSAKNRRGGVFNTPPSRAKVNTGKIFSDSKCSRHTPFNVKLLSHGQMMKLTMLNLLTRQRIAPKPILIVFYPDNPRTIVEYQTCKTRNIWDKKKMTLIDGVTNGKLALNFRPFEVGSGLDPGGNFWHAYY